MNRIQYHAHLDDRTLISNSCVHVMYKCCPHVVAHQSGFKSIYDLPTNAASEDRTHDLGIMRPTRYQLRYSRLEMIDCCTQPTVRRLLLIFWIALTSCRHQPDRISHAYEVAPPILRAETSFFFCSHSLTKYLLQFGPARQIRRARTSPFWWRSFPSMSHPSWWSSNASWWPSNPSWQP